MRRVEKHDLFYFFLWCFLSLGLHLFFPPMSLSHDQDFTAATIGNYTDVTVMEVTGSYDAFLPDGSRNIIPKQGIAKEFLATHPDNYDFLVIFTNFDFRMPEYQVAGETIEATGDYHPVKNDVLGIGEEIFDNSHLYGSDSKIQGIIDMGCLSDIVSNPFDPGFEFTMATLSHQLLHRWGAYITFEQEDGTISPALLGSSDLEGKEACHWSFLLDTAGSVHYGNSWQDSGDGTFTSLTMGECYSPLDLYLMGFLDKFEIPPLLLIENRDIDPQEFPMPGLTIEGTAHYISMEDIVAAEGERIPNAAESQKIFKMAFILITRPDTFTSDELYEIRNIIQGWVMRYTCLTGGRGIIRIDSAPLENIPSNPGVTPAVYDLRGTPEIEAGVYWIMNHQKEDGSWADANQTTTRDTAQVLIMLKEFPFAEQSFWDGVNWLDPVFPENTDYLSRKIEALVYSERDVTTLLAELISRQNPDGGWGSNKNYVSNPTDTSLALKVLAAAGFSDDDVLAPAVQYLKGTQIAAGGWGRGGEGGGGSIPTTADALFALNRYKDAYTVTDEIQDGLNWLLSRRNPDGGFGCDSSTIYDTAAAILILVRFNVSSDVFTKALTYIQNLQAEDGSWLESPYQTSLAVRAWWKIKSDSDLCDGDDHHSNSLPAYAEGIFVSPTYFSGLWGYDFSNLSFLYNSRYHYNSLGNQGPWPYYPCFYGYDSYTCGNRQLTYSLLPEYDHEYNYNYSEGFHLYSLYNLNEQRYGNKNYYYSIEEDIFLSNRGVYSDNYWSSSTQPFQLLPLDGAGWMGVNQRSSSFNPSYQWGTEGAYWSWNEQVRDPYLYNFWPFSMGDQPIVQINSFKSDIY